MKLRTAEVNKWIVIFYADHCCCCWVDARVDSVWDTKKEADRRVAYLRKNGFYGDRCLPWSQRLVSKNGLRAVI